MPKYAHSDSFVFVFVTMDFPYEINHLRFHFGQMSSFGLNHCTSRFLFSLFFFHFLFASKASSTISRRFPEFIGILGMLRRFMADAIFHTAFLVNNRIYIISMKKEIDIPNKQLVHE